MVTETEAKSIVKKNKGGIIEGCYGPSRIAGHEVWEIWSHSQGEYVTRFVASASSGPPQYYSSFGELCVYLDSIHEAQNTRISALSTKHHVSKIRLYVAAITFLAAVAVLLFLMVRPQPFNAVTFLVFASLIASGGTLFFGVWRQVSVADLS